MSELILILQPPLQVCTTTIPTHPAFQLFFEVNWGDTTGLGYGGFWRLPVDYMVDLSAALHPDSTGNEVPVYNYIADWAGAFEEFESTGCFCNVCKKYRR